VDADQLGRGTRSRVFTASRADRRRTCRDWALVTDETVTVGAPPPEQAATSVATAPIASAVPFKVHPSRQVSSHGTPQRGTGRLFIAPSSDSVLAVALNLDADEIMLLSVDELALRVLRDAADDGAWNWKSWLLDRAAFYQSRTDAMEALAEAWGWIESKGLILRDVHKDAFSFKISRLGRQTLELGLLWLGAMHRLDLELSPALQRVVRPLYLKGEFEIAVFAAFKEVEVRVRDLAGLPHSDFGVKLMHKAFRPPGGPLCALSPLEPSEAEAQHLLFAGAFGLLRNPPSHRRVDYEDAVEAVEVILLADLLLRLLVKIESTA